MIDPELRTWATVRQLEYIDAIEKHGSARRAATVLKVSHSVLTKALKSLHRRAASQGYSPAHDMTHVAPSPFLVKGVSTYYNAEGKASGQWVKTARDQSLTEELVREMVEAVIEDAKGKSKLVDPPKRVHSELMAVYPWGDPHFGLYAWARESGDDFDLETAERLTLGAVDRLVSSAPPAETAVILPLGDFFHMDDQTNQTPAHKHQLDADGRFPKVLSVGIKALRHAIVRCLEKHQRVIVRIEPGNHDPHAKWALTLTIAAYFENNPRVEVDLSPSKFWFYRFGKVLIGSTHGDTVKHEALPGIMAADRAEDWGVTLHRYWYTGHIHTSVVKEFPGVSCESFRTLAAKDAWTAGHGYRAGRDMRCIIHHKDHGEIERHRCDISMLS